MPDAPVLEPPATQAQIQPATGPTTQGIVVNSIADLLKDSRNLVGKVVDVPQNQEPPKQEEPPKEEPPKETPPVVQPPAKGSKEESLANLRKASEAAAKERDEWRQKFEAIEKEHTELKSKPFELPEEYQTKLTTLEQERERYSQELAAASLERHPEFVQRYQKAIEGSVSNMQRIALAAGIPADDVKRGMGQWSENTFSEWLGSMNELQRGEFVVEYNKANSTFNERQQKLAEAGKEWENINKTRETEARAQHEAVLSGNTKLVNKLLKELIDDNEGLKDYEDLRGVAEAVALKAARFEMSPEEVFKNVIANQSLARVTVKQKESLDKLTADLAERDKKIAELEAFVAQHASSTPRPTATGAVGGNGNGEAHVAPWQRIQVKA